MPPEKLRRRSKILFITASPRNARALDHAREHAVIRRAIHGRFELRTWLNAEPSDLVLAIQAEKPAVVHFSGHGTNKGGLVFQKENRTSTQLTKRALDALLAAEELMAPVRLIVLNACFTSRQAEGIARKGPNVIAMKRDVLDTVAIAFSERYYRALVDGMSFAGALPAAIAAMEGDRFPEADTPEYYAGIAPPIQPPSRRKKNQTAHLSNIAERDEAFVLARRILLGAQSGRVDWALNSDELARYDLLLPLSFRGRIDDYVGRRIRGNNKRHEADEILEDLRQWREGTL